MLRLPMLNMYLPHLRYLLCLYFHNDHLQLETLRTAVLTRQASWPTQSGGKHTCFHAQELRMFDGYQHY